MSGSASYLIDTNVISERARRAPHRAVVAWLDVQTELVVSAVTLYELEFGVRKRGSAALTRWFAELMPALRDLPVTREIALLAGHFQAVSLAKGLQVAPQDMLIAGTAAHQGRILVTRNMRDFAHCPVTLFNPFTG